MFLITGCLAPELTPWVWVYLPHVVEWPTTQEKVQHNYHPAGPNEHKAGDDATPVFPKTRLYKHE